MRLPLRKGCTSCFSHRVAVVDERWRARGRAWSRSQEHGRVVTYIVYVRVCLYRLFATVYIFYLSAHLERRPWRLQHSRVPAPGRLRPPPSLTARRHERRFWSSDRAACVGRYVLRSFRGPSVSLRFIRSQEQRYPCTIPTRHTPQTRAAHGGHSHPLYDRECT